MKATPVLRQTYSDQHRVAFERNERRCALGPGMALLLSALSACSLTPPAKPVLAGPLTLNRRTAPGTEVRVSAYTTVSPTCTTRAAPPIYVLTPPGHGKVSIRSGSFLITRFGRGESICPVGKYWGEGVFYTPDPGFVGTDEFRYTVVFRNLTQYDTAIISVQ